MVSLVKTPRFDPVEVPARLRKARESHGLSRPALLKRLKSGGLVMEEDTLRKKEAGENPFYLDEIRRICDALEAPSLFPFMEWGEAKLADKLLGRTQG
jgi:transcriptional regulator with XRE-family HTH domain